MHDCRHLAMLACSTCLAEAVPIAMLFLFHGTRGGIAAAPWVW